MNENNGLTERQVMILSHVVTSTLRDGDSVVETLKDLRGSLQRLGATDEDIEAMGAYISAVGDKLRQNNNVGWW